MKWPRRKKPVTLKKDADTEGIQNSRQQYRQVKSNWSEINGLVTRLGQLNENNHYSELITEAFRGQRK